MTENIKHGQTRVAFGDVVQLCRERSKNPIEDGFNRYVGLDHLEPGDLKIRRWGNIEEGTTFTSVFHAGQVLFGKRRAYQRKVAVADFDGVCSGDIYVFEPKNDRLLPELLPFICQTDGFFNHALGTSAGSLSPRTNWDSLSNYKFALPPIEEQHRIVEALEAIKVQTGALVRALAVSSTLEKTIFSHSLCGALNNYRGDLKQSRFGMVPVKWNIVPISTIADVAYGISEAVSSNKDPSIGWPILTGANITLSGTLDLSKASYIKAPKKESFILRRGDLLLNWRSGSEEHVGKTAIFDIHANYTYASFILRIRVDDKTNGKFLWRLLNHMREFHLFGTATSQQINFKMNAAIFREVEVIMPPKEIQDGIVEVLKKLWTLQDSITNRIEATRYLTAKMIEDMT